LIQRTVSPRCGDGEAFPGTLTTLPALSGPQ